MNILVFNGGTSNKNTTPYMIKFVEQCVNKGHNVIYLNSVYEDCRNCNYCSKVEKCCIKDDLTKTLTKCDINAFIIGTPIYFFSMSAKAKSFLDRLYFLNKKDKLFGLITMSGSPYEESGADLIEEVISRSCEYCGSHFAFSTNRVTGDDVIPIDDYDIKVINDCINILEETYNEIKKSKE